MKIFVIPATYNEADNIEKFITVLEEEVFPKIKGHEMYILVADDYSPRRYRRNSEKINEEIP